MALQGSPEGSPKHPSLPSWVDVLFSSTLHFVIHRDQNWTPVGQMPSQSITTGCFQVNAQSLWHFSLPLKHFQVSPPHPPSTWARHGPRGFSSSAKPPNPHSPWPRECPMQGAHIALCSQPEKGQAKDWVLLCRGVGRGFPGAPIPGAPQPLTSTPGLSLVTPCGFSPYWKLETPGSASPAPRL